jgi:methionine synthase II (cobalamin-independent)
VAEGSYDFVAESLFGGLEVDGFFLEYDDVRSGGAEPLRFVPPGKRVVLCLVTTERPELGSKDDLDRRIDEAAR